MTIQKELQFLGKQQNDFQDGSCYYQVNFYDPEGSSTVKVNLGGKSDLVGVLDGLKFGTLVLCQMELVEKDKLWKLALRNVAPLK